MLKVKPIIPPVAVAVIVPLFGLAVVEFVNVALNKKLLQPASALTGTSCLQLIAKYVIQNNAKTVK
jgi:hypothetical protein